MKRKTVVAFDFDGTLTRRDTLAAFIGHACGRGRFLLGLLVCSPWIAAWKCRLCSNAEAKQHLFRHFFGGMAAGEFDRRCRRFVRERGDSLLRPGARSCIADHLRQGHEAVIISASPDNWVGLFARSLGIRHVLGTQLEMSPDGCLTGRFATPNCYGREKVSRLLALFPDRTAYRLIAYGDSRGDRELLDFADETHYKPFRT